MTYDPERRVEVPCILCGRSDAEVVFPAGVAQVNQIVRCRCGLMYASPRRDPDCFDIESWPDDPSFDYAVHRPQRFEKERLQVRDYQRTRSLLAALHPQRGRLVEVASSLGFLLDAFRADGWDVLGVEPDKNGVRNTKRMGIDAICSTLEEAKLPSASAEAVVALHVIEHVPDPAGTLREVFRILRPGGTFVLETPRYDTLAFRMLGRRERSISCDGHIYFFTRDTLLRVSQAAGFELIRFEDAPRSLSVDRLLFNLAVITKIPAVQRRLPDISRKLGLHRMSLRLNLKDAQRMILRKPVEVGS
jgi:SAM-dependent methyltransferase